MKNLLRNIVRQAIKNNFIWAIFQPIIKLSDFLKYQRSYTRLIDDEQLNKVEFDRIKSILKEPIVKNGPFKGLKYPDYSSFGSAIFPKIIGSYEKEISTIIEEAYNNNYSEIIDIGCAEGYYAVGLAIKIPNAKVYAFDIDSNARKYCKQMADLNNVSERVIIESECTSQILYHFKFTNKGLVICDCEGYEKKLFTQATIKNLINCDLIIETHDFIDLTISEYIENLFALTHNISIIRSIDDIIKAKTYSFPETNGLDLQTKRKIFSEGRPVIMEWYYLESKNFVSNDKHLS